MTDNEPQWADDEGTSFTKPTTYADKVAAADAAREPLAPRLTKADVEAVNRLPMGRWLRIRKTLELDITDIMQDGLLTMMVAAAEADRAAHHGRDDYPRFLKMGAEEIAALFDIEPDDDDQAAEGAEKSDGGTA